MSDTAVAAPEATNTSQSGAPAIPNEQRAPVEAPKTPATPPVDDKSGTPPADTQAPVEAPKLGDEAVDDPNKLEAPTSADADENGVITYPETGDVGMDMALEFVGKLGIGMDHPAMQATLNNDFGPIEAVLHEMGDKAKGYERFLALAKEANSKALAKAEARVKETNTAVAAVLGENQKAILDWASKTATPAEKAEINAMLAAGPVQARAAANLLLGAFNKASGNVVQPASATKAATGEAPTQSLTRISKSEFARETNKLHRSMGAAYRNSPEYATLLRRLG